MVDQETSGDINNQIPENFNSQNTVAPIITQQPVNRPQVLTKNKIIILGAVLVVLIIIGVGGYYLVSKDKTTPPVAQQESSTNKNVTSSFAPLLQKPQTSNSGNASNSASSPEKELALKEVNYLQKMLQCQYAISKLYPESITAIDPSCITQPDFTLPSQLQNIESLNYISGSSGQSYTFQIPTTSGNGYIVTEKGATYVTIDQSTKVEAFARARDASRIADLGNIKRQLDIVAASAGSTKPLCVGSVAECVGKSTESGASAVDGSGWIKVDNSYNSGQLQLDPVNNSAYHYLYCADNSGWEIISVLESNSYASTMQNDSGNDPSKYEVGTNLNLLNKAPNCKY